MLNFTPRSIEKVEDARLRIIWDDGHQTELPFTMLRRQCPCAMCKDEWTGESLLDPATVPETLGATRADIVGNYALSSSFSDGHGAGIYTFEMLRKLCCCKDCEHHTGSETN
ncbi:MAG: hypothetical protein COV48_05425 [Elusimicrobia bacterium CG11_big_fil_rev_8_21_14_0_20_64_6]|nr:MAG: hypothetical protein COV48_05425 [Elusimicrobia bacterium CG11_big_fil_rev_8_21_14_0_20_64_6]